MRVLITGATGYVGHAVVRELLGAGHTPRLLLRPTTDSTAAQIAGTEVVVGDVLDRASLAAAVEDVDAVVHLAALGRVRESFERPVEYFRVNVGGTLNLLDAMADRVPRLVLASTGSVYGAPERQPITELATVAPTNPYAASKAAAEQAVRWAAQAGQVRATTLRLFNVAGAAHGRGDPDDSRVITRTVAVAAGRLPRLDVFGDGASVRDFVHVADVARAITLAAQADPPGGHATYNLGASQATVTEIIDAVRRVTGREVPIDRHAARPGESRCLRADTTAIRRALSWRPTRSTLEEIIASQWQAERAG
ncbi:UDP-glucose 4-epimerase [Solihabitans fulvus]|uniref:UDP-glucose 4-epimerase n=1 Tax=Solihabitans fulvus TaxID=1892852 RepID=A0A5B2XPW2_9PSEU|nr:NAD-dependent epimerase/dehydratase family protein [Solihabitans fulvus]KAA2264899.1 UDP-glucose 4-epimerase [Solihabitans fulvus]